MGQKVNPISFRVGQLYTWSSRWFTDKKDYKNLLIEDFKIRKALMVRLKMAGIARVEIERSINRLGINLFVSRPGVVIGRGGTGLEDLKKFIQKDIHNDKIEIKVEAVKEPNLDAYLVGINITEQLIKRMPAKRILKQTAEKVMSAGAKGVRIRLGGRINGAEIARVEHIQQGVLPFSTIKENIDFAAVPARTRSGYIGVKVWICKS